MSAVELAKKQMSLNKMSRKELNTVAYGYWRQVEELKAKLAERDEELRQAQIAQMAAESVADLRDIEVHENAARYHDMARNYHGLALEKERKLTEDARYHSRGLESDVDDLMGRILDAIGLKYGALHRHKQKKLVAVLKDVCERIKVPF